MRAVAQHNFVGKIVDARGQHWRVFGQAAELMSQVSRWLRHASANLGVERLSVAQALQLPDAQPDHHHRTHDDEHEVYWAQPGSLVSSHRQRFYPIRYHGSPHSTRGGFGD